MTTALEALAAPIEAATLEASDTIPKDIALRDLVFNGKRLKSDLIDAVLSASIRRTIEGASELKFQLADPELNILNSNLFAEGGTIEVDDLGFSYVKFGKAGKRLNLVFEDREVAKLREFKKARKVYRDKINRVAFARSLVREAKTINFFTANSITPGFSKNETIKIRGKKGTAEQRRVLHRVLKAGHSATPRIPTKVLQAAALVCAADAKGRNGTIGTMVGALAQGPRWGSVADRKNIEKAAAKFYTAAMRHYRAVPSRTPAQIAKTVYPSRNIANYNRWQAEAKLNVKTWLGIENPDTAHDKKVKTVRYAFSRGLPTGPKGEDSWACLQRLATEVGWRCFMVRGTVWFVSEEHLFKMQPVATITPRTIGVDDVDFDNDKGKPVSEAKITARVSRWKAQPGSVIVIDGYGSADGRWLVVETERSLFSTTMTITVRKPIPKLPEPRPEVIKQTTASSAPTVILSGTTSQNYDPYPTTTLPTSGTPNIPATIVRAYNRAKAIDAKRYPYVWGGGHGPGFGPTGGLFGASTPGYDCSGAVSSVLGPSGADRLLYPYTSGRLASWGAQGRGKYMTVYANLIHTFIIFTLPGKGSEHFGTGRWGENFSGAGFKPNMHPTTGFTPRHIYGM